MTNRKRSKMVVDVLMSLLLLFLMAYQVTGELWHEWCGTAMLLLFILHNILNWKWYTRIFQGRYTPLRILMTVINLLCLASMLALMVSGIMMSRFVFVWLPIQGGMLLARMMHMSASYLGFVFMSAHIGLHGGMMRAALGRKTAGNRVVSVLIPCLMGLVSLYGLYTFVQARLWRYMFLQDMFVFMDYEKSAVLVLFENLSMMVLWAVFAYCVALFLTPKKGSSRLGRYFLFLFQYLFLEKTRGLDFTMRKLTESDEKKPRYHGYSKTNEKHLRAIFSELSYEECTRFLDIGCGKGVVLKEAAKFPFEKVAGIELMSDLVETANKNFRILKLEDKITCIEANAIEFAGYSEYDTFFLFNPFGEEILREVAKKLEETGRKNQRTITIIYHNPQFIKVFEEMEGYHLEKELYDSLKEYRTCIFQIKAEAGQAL